MSLPTKAPPPAPVASAWSGFVEIDAESFLINPNGQALVNGFTVTSVAGLNLNLYSNKSGFINSFTVGGGVAADWTNTFTGAWAVENTPSQNGNLFDEAVWISAAVTFGQYWTLGEQFFNVYSGDVGLTGSSFPTLIWNELKLSLNDSFTGWPITFNPYVTWYYELPDVNGGGVSAACFTCQVNASEFFIGAVPTISLEKPWGIPLTLKAPTYVTVASTNYWAGGGLGLGFGTIAPAASSGGIGIFSTGLTGIMPLTWMPPAWGHWFAKAGFQWYDIVNSALVGDNAFSVGSTSTGATSSIFVAFGGVGVGF